MKNILLLLIVICCVLTEFPASAQDGKQVAGSVNFQSAPVDMVLNVYRDYAKVELITASNVHGSRHTITLNATNVSREMILQMIEEALQKQAGIVITRIDKERFSVTYNDQLKLEPQ